MLAALAGAAIVGSAAPQDDAGAKRCAGARVRMTMKAFATAFTNGEAARLDRLFAREPGFKWYSSGVPGERVGASASERETLVEYFTSRHAAGDRIALRTFRFVGNANGVGHFHGTFSRSAGDFRSGTPFVAVMKGDALCRGPKTTFAVLSIGPAR